jgi:biopolymer transport protein ExbB/TolQ
VPTERGRRGGATWAAFLIGLPLAVGFLTAVDRGLLHNPLLERYLGHLVERVEVILFGCALGTLAAKLLALLAERRALRAVFLPKWDGKAVGVEEAPALLAHIARRPGRLRNTFLYQRIAAVLDFLSCRKSADDLDDQLRALSDTDALALDASYSLTRFITWAIPILGFLGTVLGITGAISGITPEVLEKSLSGVTDGLALAFDATALALSLTMTTMFLTFLVERAEGGVLEAVDRCVERELAHRFARTGWQTPPNEPGPAQLQAFAELVQKLATEQAEALARAVSDIERRAAEALAPQQEKLAAALDAALERTLQAHLERLAAVERGTVEQGVKLFQQMGQVAVAVRETGQESAAALKKLSDAVAAQSQLLLQVQQGERQLLHLQTVLQQNLTALTGAGAFEKAVHSLTAAIHLLTARSAAAVPQAVPLRLLHPDEGKAA